MSYEVKIEMTPGYPGVSTLYKKADTNAELARLIADAKYNVSAYRISVNGREAYERTGSGAKSRWATLSGAKR